MVWQDSFDRLVPSGIEATRMLQERRLASDVGVGRWRSLDEQSVHYVDLMQWMVGDVESLYGNCANVWHDIVVEDTAVATIRFKDGTIGSLEGTTAATRAQTRAACDG